MTTQPKDSTSEHGEPVNFGEDLTRVHKFMTRGIRVAAEQSARLAGDSHTDPELETGLERYVRALIRVLRNHHHGEDTLCWPELRRWLPEAPYETLVHQHETLTKDLAAAEAARKRRDWGAVHAPLERVRLLWADHIAIEEDAFSISATAAAMPPEAHHRLLTRVERHAQRHAMPIALVVPFTLYNLEPDDRAAMARMMPGILTAFLLPVIWKRRWAPMKPFLLPE
ncbi:MAG: hemerythrin domain-containing protein [Anaerolineae bacterium]|nr:hemerythrin domain-containing protein [Anaerolineae bacterium]